MLRYFLDRMYHKKLPRIPRHSFKKIIGCGKMRVAEILALNFGHTTIRRFSFMLKKEKLHYTLHFNQAIF